MSKATSTITHSGGGKLHIISTNQQVQIETVTFTGAAISDVTTLGMSGDITMSKATASITHSGSTKLHIVSSSGTVQIESVIFNAGAITGAAAITMGGALSGVTTLAVSALHTTTDNIVMSNNAAAITHSGSTALTISSGVKVLIEDVTFTGSAITGAGAITSNGALTIGGALSGVTSLAAS